jgi:hypothetical protein
MENVLGTDRPAAIYAFRELAQVIVNGLGNIMDSYENKVIYYHKIAPKKRSIHVREVSNGDCKSKKKKPKCPFGQLVAMIKNAPICQDKWPNGQKKNQKGDECESDCSVDQIPKAAGDGCEACVNGEKPNAKGDRCEKEVGDQDKCADGEVKTGSGGRCDACATDRKPIAGGDTCEPKTEEDKEKDKEMEDKNKRMKRIEFCLSFVEVILDDIKDRESCAYQRRSRESR